MKVFLSYAVGPWDGPIPARLRAVAAAYDIAILLPIRNQVVQNGLTADTLRKIKQSDAVIALVTNTAPKAFVKVVNIELQGAAKVGKPIIALVEAGVPFQVAAPANVVYFDRRNPTAHESSLMNAIKQIRSRQPRKKDFTALGWIVGIALGLVALGEVVGNEK